MPKKITLDERDAIRLYACFAMMAYRTSLSSTAPDDKIAAWSFDQAAVMLEEEKKRYES